MWDKKVKYCKAKGEEKSADILTKYLARDALEQFVGMLGGYWLEDRAEQSMNIVKSLSFEPRGGDSTIPTERRRHPGRSSKIGRN